MAFTSFLFLSLFFFNSECRLHVLPPGLRCKERSGDQLRAAAPYLEERPVGQQAQVCVGRCCAWQDLIRMNYGVLVTVDWHAFIMT